MTTNELLGERGKALEDEFFRRQDEVLRAKLRSADPMRETKQQLAEASGIANEAVLNRLLHLGIRAETVAPLALVPLVEVAWADGKIDAREQRAVLSAAKSVGLGEGTAGYALLKGWLSERPELALRAAWAEYIRGLCQSLSVSERENLMSDLLGRARAVAEASGGFLGLGSKVSEQEERVLAELASVFGS